ncbi:unnamed protein product, partial [Lymnaea stagnalis]
MLVLEMIIFQYCRDHDWDFLPFRVWIGLWTTFILLLIVAFDLSALVRYITRFTEECFASLIALIFIYEAFAKVIKINSKYPVFFGSYHDVQSCPVSTVSPENSSNTSQSLPLLNSSIVLGNTTTSPFDLDLNTTGSWVTTTLSLTLNTTTTLGPFCHSYVGDVFFLSVIEFLFTFGIAFFLV